MLIRTWVNNLRGNYTTWNYILSSGNCSLDTSMLDSTLDVFLFWDFYSQLFHSIIVIILNVLWFVFYFCFMFIYHRCVFNSWVLIYLIRNIWIWICCFLKVRNCLCHVNLIILQSLRTQRIVSIMQHRMLRRRMQRFLSIFQSFIFF